MGVASPPPFSYGVLKSWVFYTYRQMQMVSHFALPSVMIDVFFCPIGPLFVLFFNNVMDVLVYELKTWIQVSYFYVWERRGRCLNCVCRKGIGPFLTSRETQYASSLGSSRVLLALHDQSMYLPTMGRATPWKWHIGPQYAMIYTCRIGF